MNEPGIDVRDARESVVLRHLGSRQLSLVNARFACAGLLFAAPIGVVQGFMASTPSTVFRHFFFPVVAGALAGGFSTLLFETRKRSSFDSHDLAIALGTLGTFGYYAAVFRVFIPRWSVGAWWAFAGAGLAGLGLVLLLDLLTTRDD